VKGTPRRWLRDKCCGRQSLPPDCQLAFRPPAEGLEIQKLGRPRALERPKTILAVGHGVREPLFTNRSPLQPVLSHILIFLGPIPIPRSATSPPELPSQIQRPSPSAAGILPRSRLNVRTSNSKAEQAEFTRRGRARAGCTARFDFCLGITHKPPLCSVNLMRILQQDCSQGRWDPLLD